MSADDEREPHATVGSTIPDPNPDRVIAPQLATFDRPAERFQLGEELGRGGMGRVVAATDVSLARSVAIKQVLSQHPDDLVRFEREVRITAELEHPSIVPIHEAARGADGRPYYVMRRIDGDPLTARLTGDLRSRLALLPNLLAVVDAAAFAHARNIIHRDIKPSNILLGAYGETHLIDWGLARRLDDLDISVQRLAQSDQLTQAGHVYGTVGYMAPEQARGEQVDARADVYALGATLFHVLSGRAPFAHLSDVERLSAAVTGDDDVPFDKLAADVPRELIAIVEKAMARERSARYPHAGELAADLRAFLGGKLVGAHRYTVGQRLGRFVRKHRFAVALTVASLVTVAIILVVAVLRILEERDAAELERSQALARADLLLIERASALAPTEPSRAAALLLTLRTDTPHQDRARDAIAKLAAFGLARGAVVHTKQVNGLAFSPDGTMLASVGVDGLVVTYDVATGVARTLIDLRAQLSSVVWLDARTLLVTGGALEGARVIDVSSRTVRTVGEGAMANWWRTTDRLRYYHPGRQAIHEMPLAGGAVREVARDVLVVVGHGDTALYTTEAGVFALAGYESSRIGEPTTPVAMAISPDGTRAALSTTTSTIEWVLATGKETRRWTTGTVGWLDYAPQGLVTLGVGVLNILYPQGRISQRGIRFLPLWHTQIADGLAMINEVGEVTVLDRAGYRVVDQHHLGSRVIASRMDRNRTIALGSRDGSVRWLDLAPVAPHPIPLPPGLKPCTVTSQAVLGIHGEGVTSIDLATHEARNLTAPDAGLSLGFDCTRTFGDRLIAFSPMGISIADLVRHTFVSIQDTTIPMVDGDRALYGIGTGLLELTPGRDEARQIFTAPAAIERLAVSGHWVVMVLVDNRILRLDRSTGDLAETVLHTSPETFGVTPEGEAWLTQENLLLSWSGSELRLVAPFRNRIEVAFRWKTHSFVKLVDGSLWDVADGIPQQRFVEGLHGLQVGGSIAISHSPQQITTHFLASGETIARDFEAIGAVKAFEEGRGLLVQTSRWALVFRDVVPDSFPAAKTWLARATNAHLDEAGAVSWRSTR